MTTSKQAARRLAAQVLQQVEPDQLENFELLADAYLNDPDRILRGGRERDEALGFGLGGAETILIGAVVFVANAVVTQLISRATDHATDRANATVRRLFRSRQKPAAAASEQLVVTPEQATTVRDIAYAKAIEVGLVEAKAQSVADAVVEALLRQPPA